MTTHVAISYRRSLRVAPLAGRSLASGGQTWSMDAAHFQQSLDLLVARPTLEHAQEHQIAGWLVHRSRALFGNNAGSIGRRDYRPYHCFRYRSHWENG
jgi:hypothetical protein